MVVDMDLDRRSLQLKALAEPARLRIVERLAKEEVCVCHLVEDLGVPQPLVSHHLKALREAGLVESERFKQWTYYRLVPDVLATLASTIEELANSAGHSSDHRRPCC
jgi:ArsR family transcriptional regulator